jgi:hypothetical protein
MKKTWKMFKLMPWSLRAGWLLIVMLYLLAFIMAIPMLITGKVVSMMWVAILMVDVVVIVIVGMASLLWRISPDGKKVDED